MTRRGLLAATLTGTVGALAGCGTRSDGAADGGSSPTAEPTASEQPASRAGTDRPTADPARDAIPARVGLDTVATGFNAPVDVAVAPDADRRYVADQVGVVHVHEADGLRDRPFLDLGGAVDFGGEKGLLGLALHPAFADNRRVYVRYSAPPRDGTPTGYSHTFVLSEFTATADGRRVRPGSERTLLEIPEPQSNHNAGAIAFGPDGFLYVGVGDGGAGGDQGRGHVSDWYDGVGGGNGQDVTQNLLGSILRIDVDDRDGPGAYGIPDDNPLVGRSGLDEHYAWGFRNPWRLSFDGPDLYVGDVGQNRYEEVDLVTAGGNYGWNVREGTHCYGTNGCPDRTPDDVRGGEALQPPIVEYPHSGAAVSGISVIGGVVARGPTLPGLVGRYVFGDLDARGRLFVATPPDGGGQWPTSVLPVADGDADKLERILSFGRDADGDVYVLGTGAGGGGLHRLVTAP